MLFWCCSWQRPLPLACVSDCHFLPLPQACSDHLTPSSLFLATLTLCGAGWQMHTRRGKQTGWPRWTTAASARTWTRVRHTNIILNVRTQLGSASAAKCLLHGRELRAAKAAQGCTLVALPGNMATGEGAFHGLWSRLAQALPKSKMPLGGLEESMAARGTGLEVRGVLCQDTYTWKAWAGPLLRPLPGVEAGVWQAVLPACPSAMTRKQCGRFATSPCSSSRCSPMSQQQQQRVSGLQLTRWSAICSPSMQQP